MEMPPTMPSLLFIVFPASCLPAGTDTVAATEAVEPASLAASINAAFIMRIGTGFMAGLPTATLSPGFVTTPTPSPPITVIPGLDLFIRTRERSTTNSAPFVTSGSSPASL